MSQPLRLKKNADRRLKAGHLWIYSNEVDTRETPLKAFQAGELARVEASNGRALGVAYVNPGSLICARVMSRDPAMEVDRSLFVHRFKQALALRERLYAGPFYRLIHGEGDLLPGLVIDRFGDVVVVQLNTAGMEALGEAIVDALEKVIKPAAIVFRNDTGERRQEGLDAQVEVVRGTLPDEVLIEENGVRFAVPVLDGDSTGWFFGHRDSRAWLNRHVAGKRVLDLFSGAGGFGVQAAASGASEVLCVDTSGSALEQAAHNAELNGVHEQVAIGEGDALEALAALKADGEQFDVVVVDPPALIRKRRDSNSGERAYARYNREAMRLLGRDGLLLSASSSMHLAPERLMDVVRGAVRHQDRHGQVIFQGHQAADHPVHPAIAETSALKALGVRVFRD
ncbi:class I SAM-dependent rRNA methyltransferase [Halomonas garicola]|uniref:class I SAM-dependent rRNA methyltransferase n=1 Tax=Halomonas garicola TaxID=1690008 RepID=UPI0028A089D1|nr:class I SAM-dependent rRNA methyltransferase [Halomonas garicola]